MLADFRSCRPNSTFLLHGAASVIAPGTNMDARWHRERAQWIEQADKRMVALISSRTGCRKEHLAMLLHQARTIDSAKALEIGLVDEVAE
jgi:ATP-dependent protease ClpP protease subunit